MLTKHSGIHRRWGDARTMSNDLATYRLDPDHALPDTGDPGVDLAAWAQELTDHYSLPVNAALLRGGTAAVGENESDCLPGPFPGPAHVPTWTRSAAAWPDSHPAHHL